MISYPLHNIIAQPKTHCPLSQNLRIKVSFKICEKLSQLLFKSSNLIIMCYCPCPSILFRGNQSPRYDKFSITIVPGHSLHSYENLILALKFDLSLSEFELHKILIGRGCPPRSNNRERLAALIEIHKSEDVTSVICQ